MIEGARFPAPKKEARLASARARIEATIADPSEFNLQGYDSPADWWATQTRTYPELFTGEDAIAVPAFVEVSEDADTESFEDAAAYLASYSGSFEFLVEMRDRVRAGKGLSPKQTAAVLRCKVRDDERAATAKADPKAAEAIEYLAKRNLEGRLTDFLLSVHEQAEAGRPLSEKQVAAVLRFKANDEKPKTPAAPAPAAVTEDGMYRTEDGTIFKVQVAVHGSGNLYAKKLLPPDEFGGKATFEYEAGAIRRLHPEDRMTLAEAKAFGALYGTCCVCGRTLTDEDSISAGIGPICSGKTEWRS